MCSSCSACHRWKLSPQAHLLIGTSFKGVRQPLWLLAMQVHSYSPHRPAVRQLPCCHLQIKRWARSAKQQLTQCSSPSPCCCLQIKAVGKL